MGTAAKLSAVLNFVRELGRQLQVASAACAAEHCGDGRMAPGPLQDIVRHEECRRNLSAESVPLLIEGSPSPDVEFDSLTKAVVDAREFVQEVERARHRHAPAAIAGSSFRSASANS